MRASMSFGQILTTAIAFSSTASAWPSWLPEVDALVVRQEESSKDTTAPTKTADPKSDAKPSATDKPAPSTTKGGDEPQTTNLNTGGITQTGKPKASHTGNSTAQPTHETFDPQDPAGGVSMVTPAAVLGTQLYRIGQTITWGWNYTSLQATPTAIDVLVSCSTASRTWTLTQNMTYETKGSYTWDTHAYAETAVQNQLLTAEYTLLIYDSDSNVKATAEAGYLSTFDGFRFGLYQPQDYVPLNEWKCATCSGAANLDAKALGFAMSMSVITILSFTWFVAGFGQLL
ncbi:hypothetical protein PG996_011693 [Apiospora saccharicola]|uniref:DUF7137 domain-containing protein n=1 Tax=Apiospora saccharicola TaxID=335842 RepID=A0ABR1UI35_9PEZI